LTVAPGFIVTAHPDSNYAVKQIEGRYNMDSYGPKIAVTHKDGITIAQLLDEEILEEGTINDITESLFAVVGENQGIKLLITFTKVKHFSSSALGMLIRLNKRVGQAAGVLKLCKISPSLYEIFVITKLNKLFEIYDDQEQAINSFS
jgi:anti-sigma B factor antagonist